MPPRSNEPELSDAIEHAASLIEQADALIVAAGAGMGVDSGLPDFRGAEGFWRAYPALREAKMDFYKIASPRAFQDSPELAWGFYGHRLALYRATRPHGGFAILRRFGANLPDGAWVFTSNVDGQFQKAGFDAERICEIHGSIHHLQCREPCCEAIWSAEAFDPEVDPASCRLRNQAPICPFCGSLARPNILMFGDFSWIESRTRQQQEALDAWRQRVRRLMVIELGAGLAVPTVRWYGESLGVPLLRINTTQPEVTSARAVGVAAGAAEALSVLAALMRDRGWVTQDEDR